MSEPQDQLSETFENWNESLGKTTQELTQTFEKLFKGYENLQEIEEIEIGTAEKEEVFKVDKVRLWHYKSEEKKTVKTPMMITYALVNRYEMMDLQPDRSMIRNLLSQGIDLYVVDWGYPTRNDRFLTLDDYINGYMDDCVNYIRKAHNIKRVNLLGVCQGGTFSLIYTALHPEKVQNLIPVVTPLQFKDVDEGLLFQWAQDMDVDTVVEAYGGLVPGDFLNAGFDMLKPLSKIRKYQGLIQMMDSKPKLENFLRMEKWIADSPDQAGETFRQFIKDLYQQNKLVEGGMVVGKEVDLKEISHPVLNIYATEDHLVPPESTKPLDQYIGSDDYELLAIPGGHIGLFVGGRSQKTLSPTITEWLQKRDK